MNKQLKAVIDRLEQMPKQGVSYDEKGRHGWRNPIRQDTGPILQALVLAARPGRILEIGTAHGLSMCYLASFAPAADLHTIEWDQQTALEAQANLNAAGLEAVVHCGDAMQVIADLSTVLKFDMVFLDGNKDGYLEQIKLLLKRRLLKTGCLIVADNVIDRQKECQDFLDYMEKQHAVILQVGIDPTQPEKVAGLLVARI